MKWNKIIAIIFFIIAGLGTFSTFAFAILLGISIGGYPNGLPINPILHELIYTAPFWLLGIVFWVVNIKVESKTKKSRQ